MIPSNDQQRLIEALRGVNAAAEDYATHLSQSREIRPTAELYDTIQLTRAFLAQLEKAAVAGVCAPRRLRIDFAPLFEVAFEQALSVCFEAPDYNRAVLYDPDDETRNRVLAWAAADRRWYRVRDGRAL